MKHKYHTELVTLANELNNIELQDKQYALEVFQKLEDVFQDHSYNISDKEEDIKILDIEYKNLMEFTKKLEEKSIEKNNKIYDELLPENKENLIKQKEKIALEIKGLKEEENKIKNRINNIRTEIKSQNYFNHIYYFGVLAYAHFLNRNNASTAEIQQILIKVKFKISPYFYHQALNLALHRHYKKEFTYDSYHYKARGKIGRLITCLSKTSLILEIKDIENLLENLEDNKKINTNHRDIINLINIQNLSLVLLAYLEVDFNSQHERKVAHYTNLYVANKLLTKKSPMRLNSTNFMNDPLEGIVLNNFLNIPSDNDINPHSHTFLTCFTFNHNSLNQFRLYGNTRNIECSGLSIVYDENFFESSKSNNSDRLANSKPNKLPLFRCIYIDPASGFIKIAQRSDFSFFQEYKDFETAKSNLVRYKRKIEAIEAKILTILTLFKKDINSIYEENLVISKNIDLIIKNIKFLFKHFAFQEEQECRIIRTENIESTCVIYDYENQRSFIEYDTLDDKSHIKNVYIGKASSLYFTHIIKNISSVSIEIPKVKISENPYNVIEMLKNLNLD